MGKWENKNLFNLGRQKAIENYGGKRKVRQQLI